MEALEREQHLRQLAEQRTAGLASKFWGPLRRRLGDLRRSMRPLVCQ
jgi:hypothetical protein